MFCPQCGAPQSDELKYCKACGVNLHAVRQAVVAAGSEEKFDWSKTWVAEMLMSSKEAVRREAELERERGVTPEVKRYNEIKGGVITSFAGLGISIFLFVFMQGIVLSGQNPPGDAEILSRIWVAGVIPFLVGLGIIINGLFISKKIVEVQLRERRDDATRPLAPAPEPRALRPGDTGEVIPTNFSVTEDTTRHLRTPARKTETP
jgi:hypothetical protein